MPKLPARWLRALVIAGPLLGLALAAANCSSSGGSGAACCPIDPTPSCCMRYGGHAGCGTTCDGMPIANDPGWHMENDDLGCPAWINRSTTAKLCGAPSVDADAADTGEVASDASGDVVTDETSGCTLSGATCSTGCFAVDAQRVDTTRGCVGAYEVIACVGAVDGHTGYACVVDAAGTAWRVAPSMTPTGPGWSACSAAAQAIAMNDPTPSCP
jgi:hypothetical protein